MVQVEPARDRPVVEVLLLGGRSGAGKTSVGFEVSAQLQAGGVAHCLINGDNLDAAYPKPSDDPSGERLVETNLRYGARTPPAPDAIVHGVLLTATTRRCTSGSADVKSAPPWPGTSRPARLSTSS